MSVPNNEVELSQTVIKESSITQDTDAKEGDIFAIHKPPKPQKSRKSKSDNDSQSDGSTQGIPKSKKPKKPKATKKRQVDDSTDYEFDTCREEEDEEEDEEMELNEAFASEAFTRLLKRIISLEKANKEYKSKMTALERNVQKEKETANKQITSLTNKVQQLSDQVSKLVKSGPVSSASMTGPKLEAASCWLSSADRLGLKKNSVEIPKPSQMEVKITNAILPEQADRERRKKNLLILGVNDSYSNLTTENGRKGEIQKQDKEKVERIVESIGADKTQIVSIIRFKTQRVKELLRS